MHLQVVSFCANRILGMYILFLSSNLSSVVTVVRRCNKSSQSAAFETAWSSLFAFLWSFSSSIESMTSLSNENDPPLLEIKSETTQKNVTVYFSSEIRPCKAWGNMEDLPLSRCSSHHLGYKIGKGYQRVLKSKNLAVM